jgi:murein DD-endopeptidase MepM/ murein hydrolase activator NlpD
LPPEKTEDARRFRPRNGDRSIRAALQAAEPTLDAANGLPVDGPRTINKAEPSDWFATHSSGASGASGASGGSGSSGRRRPFGPGRRRWLLVPAACAILVVAVVAAAIPGVQPGKAADPQASGTSGATAVAALDPSASAAGSQTDVPAPTLIPTPTPLVTASPRTGEAIPGSAFLAYTVQPKDTLLKIARSFSLSPSTLYWANQPMLKDPQVVKIGQVLQVPPMDGLVITVTAGSTLATIADKYGVSTQVIVDANNLPDTKIATGDILLIPGTEVPPLPKPIVVVPTPRPPNWLGRLLWPTPGQHRITQYFGCTGWYGEPRWGKCAHYHDGLDIGAKWGSSVVAAASGTVIYAGWKKAGTDGAGGGIVVWISHGGTLYTTYNHLSSVTVKAGQKVKAGQQVGRVGNTGLAVGSHLHFEVWIAFPWTGGNIVDARNPLLYARNKG